MVNDLAADAGTGRYGLAGFATALITILVVDFVTWICLPWIVVAIFFLAPFYLLALAGSALLARRPTRAGQIGRGMFIGAIAGPLSLLFFLPAFLAVGAMGII